MVRLLTCAVATASAVTLRETESQPAATGPNRPVSRVLEVLEKMKTNLEEEKKSDAEMNKKMGCFCKKTGSQKTDAIDKAISDIESLKATITQKTGMVADLGAEVDGLKKDIESESTSLKQLTKLRTEENDKFRKEERDMVEAIRALGSAITVLKKHQSLLQSGVKATAASAAPLLSVAKVLRQQLASNSVAISALSGDQKKMLEQFVQQPTFNEYANQSGEIFGILSNMKDTFEEDLATARKEEGDSALSYAKTKGDKEKSIKSMTTFKEEKMVLQGDTKADLEQAKAEKASTEKQLGDDQAFLMQMKKDCSDFSSEYGDRTTSRNEEVEAVQEAINILGADDAHDLFTRTSGVGAAFIQLSSHTTPAKEVKAEKALKELKTLKQTPKVQALIQDIKLARFDKIFSAIDKMVGDLKTTITDDQTQRDACLKDLNGLDADITTTARDKKDLEGKQESLENTIKGLDSDITDHKKLIADAKDAMSEAGVVRTNGNADFQTSVQDQTDSINLLQKAFEVLRAVYQEKTSFLQQPVQQEFKDYKKNSGGNSVLMLLQKIIKEAQQAKALAIQAEDTAAADYEQLVKDTNASIKSYEETKTEKEIAHAAKSTELVETKEDLSSTTTSLDDLTERRKGRADDCQFLLNNFDARQEHMQKEIEALSSAKAFLNGMVA